jgi:outer membrane lipoprotein-sorting protein
MKKLLLRIALSLSLGLQTASALAQSADEVIEKHLAAIGGRDVLSKLTSRTATGTITLTTPAGDVSGSIELFAKAPNKARSLIKVDLSSFGAGELVVDQRFDGAAGYVLDTLNGNRDITGNQLDNMRNAAFPTPFLAYKDAGVKAELIGKDKVGDRDVVVVQLTPKTGSASKTFFDAETYMVLKTTSVINVPQLGRDVEQVVEFSDFRPVDGVKMAHGLKATNPVQTYSVTLNAVQHNKDIDDKLFVKPGDK